MRTLAVLTVRNEAAFLLEWLAHHKLVGFTDFLIFSNNCQDGTDNMLDLLDEMGEVTHVRNDKPDNGGVQWGALKQADKHPLMQQADWILALDIDEFVNIHCGDGTLDDLFQALPDASAITLTWRLFGNNAIVNFVDEPLLEQFTQAAPNPNLWPWRAAMIKTLYKNDGTYEKIGVHRPRKPDKLKEAQAKWFDGSGRELAANQQRIFSNYWLDNFQLVQLNHYPLGAMQSYVLKRDRGRAVHAADTLGIAYWLDRNFNQVADVSILRNAVKLAEKIADFKSNPALQQLHNQACRWRHDRFEELMLDESFRGLYGQLLMCPPTKSVDRITAEKLMGWARKAQMPDE